MPGPPAVKWKSLQGPSARAGAGPKFPQTLGASGAQAVCLRCTLQERSGACSCAGSHVGAAFLRLAGGGVRQFTAPWSRAALLLRRLRMSGLVFTWLLENRGRGRQLSLPEPRWERGGWRVYSARLRPGPWSVANLGDTVGDVGRVGHGEEAGDGTRRRLFAKMDLQLGMEN